MQRLDHLLSRVRQIATSKSQHAQTAKEAMGLLGVPGVIIEAGDQWTERTQTWLEREDNDAHAFIAKLANSLWLVVDFDPRKTPAFRVSVRQKPEPQMAQFVMAEYNGWVANTMNIEGVNCVRNRVRNLAE